MELFESLDRTIKQRRNMLIVSALMIGLSFFDIKIKKVSASGLEFENLTTDAVIIMLSFILLYLTYATIYSLYEEFNFWEIKAKDKLSELHHELDKLKKLSSYNSEVSSMFDNLILKTSAYKSIKRRFLYLDLFPPLLIAIIAFSSAYSSYKAMFFL